MGVHQVSCDCIQNYIDKGRIKRSAKWLFSLIFIFTTIHFMKPFIVNQLLYRASSYVSYELYHDAIRQYKKALFIDKDNNDAWNWLAYSYKSKGDLKKATETYKKAIEIDSQNKIALFSLGMIYAQEEDFNMAIGYFKVVADMGSEGEKQRALDLISYHHSALSMLANCYECLNKKSEMKNTLQEILKSYPHDKNAKDKLYSISR